MTINDVRKPVWNAFKLLANSGTKRLAVSGGAAGAAGVNSNSTVSVVATLGGAGGGALGLQLFVANYRRLLSVATYSCDRAGRTCKLDQRGAYTDQSACQADCTGASSSTGKQRRVRSNKVPVHPWPPPASAVTIRVKHSRQAQPPVAMITRIDSTHANAFAEWRGNLANVTYLSKKQIEQLNNASRLVPEQLEVKAISATELELAFHMPAEDSAVHVAL